MFNYLTNKPSLKFILNLIIKEKISNITLIASVNKFMGMIFDLNGCVCMSLNKIYLYIFNNIHIHIHIHIYLCVCLRERNKDF